MENNEAKMKFTINGFNQEKLIGYGLDAVDALILRYFIDFKDSGDMVIEIINNKPYYWVRYSYLISTIPIINLKSKDALRRRLKKLEKCKVLIHYHKNQGGSYSYYGIGPNYKYLIKNDPTIQKSEGATQKSEGCDSKVGGATTQKSEQKINLLKDYSNKDNDNVNFHWKEILEAWNSLPDPIKNIQAITKKRREKIQARINSLKITSDKIFQVIENVRTSVFLQGENNRGWVIDFDWVFKCDDNFAKVLEDKYKNKDKKSNSNTNYNANVQAGLDLVKKYENEENGGESIW